MADNSHADTHDDMAYGSHIRSQGDVTIAATNGDLNIIGSQVKGQNVALAASHDLNLLSQVEQHTQKQSGAHAGGQIGVSIGQSTGIFLSVNGGKARAHGNGTTHAITTVDAADTLSLIAGHDATLRGAQARGNTLLADIGHNLTLESEQDTGDFASKQWEAGLTLVYGWSSGSVGVSGHASAAGMKHHYKSVTQVTGLAAGDGGFQIHVGGNTDLKGAVIASTADPYKNWLDTGSLSWSDIHNEAKYSSWSVSVGGGAGTSPVGQSMAGLSGGIGIPQSHDQSSTTEAGIAQGTITVRHGNTSLVGLNRNPDINAKGLTNRFDRKELAEQQEMGRVAGYVGMRTVGMIAEHEQKLAARDLANATTDKDAAEAQARLDRWSTGGTYKDILHGMVGAATAALGGGNALNGALGATASEMASGQMEQYLVVHHINPDSPKGRSLMELASTAIGAAAGGGAGAATALQGEKYNRQLHVDTIDYITKHMAAKFAEAHDMTV
ncbi:MAG TPA: hemagglutinin repeat-containing protein, partial [Burkholderiaceae bacterium]|nr:hemagglutinin repeat-containing protein [Burkholderiaceae bacterium]